MDEVATLAGGCFWCTEAVFKRLKGVLKVEPGYSGGDYENPSYEDIVYRNTGHAEAIQITFDPKIISFEQILDVFWATHNPTTVNRQNYDVGPMYRSVIFYHDEQQKKIALDSKAKLEEKRVYQDPIVTEIVPFRKFYPAESYHHDYYDKNHDQPYCQIVIDPKIQKLYQDFQPLIKK